MNRTKLIILYNYLDAPLSSLTLMLSIISLFMAILGFFTGLLFGNVTYSVIWTVINVVLAFSFGFKAYVLHLKKKKRESEQRDPWKQRLANRIATKMTEDVMDSGAGPWPRSPWHKRPREPVRNPPGYERERHEFSERLDGELDEMIQKLQARVAGLKTRQTGRRSLDDILAEVTKKVELIKEKGVDIHAGKGGVKIKAGGSIRINGVEVGDSIEVDGDLVAEDIKTPAQKLAEDNPLDEEEPRRAPKKTGLMDNPLLDD